MVRGVIRGVVTISKRLVNISEMKNLCLLGERSEPLHTSKSQLRSDMCICLYHKSSKVNACPFPAAMFKRQR